MKKDYIDITIVLDRSGSMDSVRDDTVGGLNAFLKTQREVPVGEARLTLIQFDNDYEPLHRAVDVKVVPDFTLNDFLPRGSTALLDAMGRAIDEAGERFAAMPEEERPEKVIFAIITDGQENSSQKYTRAQVNERISRQTKDYGWSFLFLAANQDAIMSAAQYGIGAGQAMNYKAGGLSNQSAFASVGSVVGDVRMTKTLSAFKEEDRAAAMDDNAAAAALRKAGIDVTVKVR